MGRMRFAPAIILVAGLAACSGTTTPDATRGQIRGSVVDASRVPVAGATIMLQHAVDSPVFQGPDKANTMLRFDLPEAGHVLAWISSYCDADTVRRLINESLPAGSYAVAWDGRDGQVRLLADGVYRIHVVTASGEERLDVLRLWLGDGELAVDEVPAPQVVTDDRGRFVLGQDCLPFGSTFVGTDVSGTPTGTLEVIRSVRVWAFSANGGAPAVSDWITVDPELGAVVALTFDR